MSNPVRTTESGGVQSVQRALDLLEALADRPKGVSVAELAAATALPMATTHRLLRTLVERGYALQLADRTYALGLRLMTLGSAANALLGSSVDSVLRELVDELGETANLAILAGRQAEYVAQAQSRHAMRMFNEIGRRVDLHSTGVGKAMLARLDPASARELIRQLHLARHTEHTIATDRDLHLELARVSERGYALDEEEQEIGVRCVAVAVDATGLPPMAVSVSGPIGRMSDAVISRATALLRLAAQRLAADLAR